MRVPPATRASAFRERPGITKSVAPEAALGVCQFPVGRMARTASGRPTRRPLSALPTLGDSMSCRPLAALIGASWFDRPLQDRTVPPTPVAARSRQSTVSLGGTR